MKLFFVSALCGLLVGTAAEPTILTDATFEASLASGGGHFVKFYAPWCGHCKRLAPTWDELSTEVASIPSVKIAKVDCTTEKDTCAAHGIRGYPTLVYFKEGDKEGAKYSGARTLEALKAFVEEQQ